MPLIYNKKEKIADIVIEQREHKFNIQMYRGNCLGVVVHTHRGEDGQLVDSLYSFFNDKLHCKNIMKNFGNMFSDKVVSIKMNMAYKESYELLPFFMDSGYKVTCYKKTEKK